MTREELKQKCFDVHIFSYHNSSIKVNPQWYKVIYPNLDISFKEELDSFFNKYRSPKEALFCLKRDILEVPKCEICGVLAKFHGKHYGIVCENHSANQVERKKQQQVETFNKNNDWNVIKEKMRKTRLERYGDENYSLFGSKSFKENMKSKYGNENYNNRKQAKETCLEIYGVTCNLSINASERNKRIWTEKYDEITRKRKNTLLKKYGKNYGQVISKKAWKLRKNKNDIFEETNNCTSQKALIKQYGQGWLSLDINKIHNNGLTYISNEDIDKIKNYIPNGYQPYVISKPEIEIYDYICSLIGKENVIQSSRKEIKLSNKNAELDIYIPSKNLAIEYNGIYWHSSQWKSKNYHLNKTIACENENIRLIHIFQDEWANNTHEIQWLLRQALGIYDITIDKCDVYNIGNKYILSYNNQEVESITLDDYTINTIHINTKYNVNDGFKYLTHYISHNTQHDITIIIDRSKYNKELYENIGYQLIDYEQPSVFYVDKLMTRYYKIPNISKHYILYDSGKIKMIYKYEHN